MKPLLKITTKPIKISVIKEQPMGVKSPASSQPTQEPMKISHANERKEVKDQFNMSVQATQGIDSLGIHSKYTKLNLTKVTYGTMKHIQQKLLQPHSRTQAFIPMARSVKYEPQRNDQTSSHIQPDVLTYQVEQYNEIHFEYTGDPIYIPASSNPNKKQ